MDIKAVGEVAEDGDGIVTYTWSKDVNAESYSVSLVIHFIYIVMVHIPIH